MSDRYISLKLEEITIGQQLPIPIYIFIHQKFITFRTRGDTIDRKTYERLELQKVQTLFIQEKDEERFRQWCAHFKKFSPTTLPLDAFNKFSELRKDAHRKMLDIFERIHPDPLIAETIESSKKFVLEVMKFPYAAKTLEQLQLYSQGTVNHSINVSVLAVYLAREMGFSHAPTLQNLGAGGLLHDIGKIKAGLHPDDTEEEAAAKLKKHPKLGVEMLDALDSVPFEVKTIVIQHHENHDGHGFPIGLRGHTIHDLTKIVSIANTFDNLMGEKSDPLPLRLRSTIQTLEKKFHQRFEPQKLDRALKILKCGI